MSLQRDPMKRLLWIFLALLSLTSTACGASHSIEGSGDESVDGEFEGALFE